jgi:hypothetical protein
MTFASSTFVNKSQTKAPAPHSNIWLSSLAFLIVFAITICLASRSPGTSPEELASMLNALP